MKQRYRTDKQKLDEALAVIEYAAEILDQPDVQDFLLSWQEGEAKTEWPSWAEWMERRGIEITSQ